jgi:hypothetical protein
MCGGDLNITEGMTVVQCEYCGTTQTVPSADSEKKVTLFSRANRLRFGCEFDKASGVYESIIAEFPEEAEAYWGLILCKYGIEYVDDPATGKKIPTCHRSSFDSVMDDSNFELVMEYSDAISRKVYRDEAKAIEELRKGIIEVSGKEDPYDIFICYKETDEQGSRTLDSVLAQDIYDALTEKGYRVFFARITLEDKLGQEYEPYIFAALHSAKVMLAIGTDYEYYNAVWVRNEWSRFLQLIAAGEKKTLIPCFKNLDPYDMPKEFARLQSQDMGKVGAMQDLLRGIEKILPLKKAEKKETVIVQAGNSNTDALLKRGMMALEDSEWQKADGFFEEVLNLNAECAEAYLGKLMEELQVQTRAALKNCPTPFDDRSNYQKALRFADAPLEKELRGYITYINDRNKKAQLDALYNKAVTAMTQARWEKPFRKAADLFEQLSGYRDADEQARLCRARAEQARKNKLYSDGCKRLDSNNISEIKQAIAIFESIPGWWDADEKREQSREKLAECQRAAVAARQQSKTVAVVTAVLVAISLVVLLVINKVIIPSREYAAAELLLNEGNYEEAANAFDALNGYKDSAERKDEAHTLQCAEQYAQAEALEEAGDILAAAQAFEQLGSYADAAERRRALLSIESVSAGGDFTVELLSTGDVLAIGDNSSHQCDVSDWTDIVAASAGNSFTVGLKADGTVVATGLNSVGQCEVSDWTDMVAVAAGSNHTVGLKSDGTVMAVGFNQYGQCNVSNWTDIVAISANDYHTVGLKSDGTVVAVGRNQYGQCDVSGWTDLVAVAAGVYHTVGLKSDGTVVAVGSNANGQCAVSDWTDIVAIAAGGYHTVGLKSDGTVVAVGYNDDGQCDVSDWTDIVAIAAGENHTVGLTADGSMVAVGQNSSGQCDVNEWGESAVAE